MMPLTLENARMIEIKDGKVFCELHIDRIGCLLPKDDSFGLTVRDLKSDLHAFLDVLVSKLYKKGKTFDPHKAVIGLVDDNMVSFGANIKDIDYTAYLDELKGDIEYDSVVTAF